MRRLLNVSLSLLLISCVALSQGNGNGPAPQPAAGNGAPEKPKGPELGGFVYLPTGTVHPGCSWEDYQARAQDKMLKMALWYDVWGQVPQKLMVIPEYFFGKHEVTNAQWKHYLDRNFRDEYECSGQETLVDIAKRLVQFQGVGDPTEWRAIYALNAQKIFKALDDADKEEIVRRNKMDPVERAKLEKLKFKWDPKWTLDNPDPDNNGTLGRQFLPKGLKLAVYRHRIPQTWYGWCRLSKLRIGREFCDASKPAADAFTVPEDSKEDIAKGEGFWTNLKLRDADFAAYPVRDVAPREIWAFTEWAGCHLPSEYEWERAGRGDRPNKDQYPFPGKWNRGAQKRIFAWADNTHAQRGPLRVDAPSVENGDSQQGARHMVGNVWELTRTFWDFHPQVSPKPPEPPGGYFNFALVAKGGSFGDGWQKVQLSTRTGQVGDAVLDLTVQNRADSLGFRLVRHPKRGYDLLMHSVMRLVYDFGRGLFPGYKPHAFSMSRMAGVDEVHITPGEAPYVHVHKKASAVAFTPLWVSDINKKGVTAARNQWKNGKATGKDYFVLGILRSDVPIRAGVRLSPKDAADLRKKREEYKEIKKKYDEQQKQKKKKRRRRRKTDDDAPIVLPPKPPDPDEFELATQKNKAVGLWQAKTLQPGEWFVVYWYGHIGLANKTLLMPPDAILLCDPKGKNVVRKRAPSVPATLTLGKDSATVSLWVEEQPDPKKKQTPPEEKDSDQWAICEILPDGWIGRKKSPWSWSVTFEVPFEGGALNKLQLK